MLQDRGLAPSGWAGGHTCVLAGVARASMEIHTAGFTLGLLQLLILACPSSGSVHSLKLPGGRYKLPAVRLKSSFRAFSEWSLTRTAGLRARVLQLHWVG